MRARWRRLEEGVELADDVKKKLLELARRARQLGFLDAERKLRKLAETSEEAMEKARRGDMRAFSERMRDVVEGIDSVRREMMERARRKEEREKALRMSEELKKVRDMTESEHAHIVRMAKEEMNRQMLLEAQLVYT